MSHGDAATRAAAHRFDRPENDDSFDEPEEGAPASDAPEPRPDPMDGPVAAEARRLLNDVHKLGNRMRENRLRAQRIDRRAAAYASRLARHTAQLLQQMPEAVPAVRPIPGTGASSLRNYVLRHDTLASPSRVRLLVVSSDGKIRICTVQNGVGTRMWDDYEVANPPAGMGLTAVFEGLSSLIVQLEAAVKAAELDAGLHEASVDSAIEESESLLRDAGSRLAALAPAAASTEEASRPSGSEPESTLPAATSDAPHHAASLTPGGLRSHGFERDSHEARFRS